MPNTPSELPEPMSRGGKPSAMMLGGSMPHVEYEEGAIVMAIWRNLTINVWGGTATLTAVDRLDTVGAKITAEHPEGFSSIHIVVENTPLPEGDVRQRLARASEHFSSQLAVVATVIEGDGFWRSAVRSFITGLHWFEKRPFEARTCSSIPELAEALPQPHWERTGIQLGSRELEQALHWVRERVGA